MGNIRYPEKMMKTAAQILAERDQERKACRLAHTPNGRGEFFARIDCPCYTCRDVLDPTGEEDAKAYNESLLPNLPPPPPIQARQTSTATSLSIISPLVGIATPRSISDTSQTIEEKVTVQEQRLTKRLEEMMKSYEQLMEHIDILRDTPGTKNDEMAMYDTWWDDVDEKMEAMQELLDVLKK